MDPVAETYQVIVTVALDIEDQSTFSGTNVTINTASNYESDEIDNLVPAGAEAIGNKSWNVYGNISQ